MRILYIDIDTLRADHLGCYGYHRNTSPNIDTIAREGVRFDNCYVSDAPCLPSRTALWSGRSGFQTGVIDHGGIAAEPFIEGPSRGFCDTFYETNWMTALRRVGYKTATVSSFAERHSAWHWYAGFSEVFNPGKRGLEIADDVTPLATDWIKRHADEDNWFLHVNYWDPHVPYRTPMKYGNPFSQDPLQSWLDEELLKGRWGSYGPGSPQDLHLWHGAMGKRCEAGEYARVPVQLGSMKDLKGLIDGYDVGIRYTDDHIGILLSVLKETGILQDTVIIISADHGESLGELNVFGDHQIADFSTSRVPLIVRWPELTNQPRVDHALHYHFDWAATLIELVGGQVPPNWVGEPFSTAFQQAYDEGREYLILSQAAWTCQRSVPFDSNDRPYLCLRTYHNGYKKLDPVMLFDLEQDPHEQNDLKGREPEVVNQAMRMLTDWHQEMMSRSQSGIDPMMTVLKQGGPFHVRGKLADYLEHLKATGRSHHVEALLFQHSEQV
jgi:choline-sulfatase